MLDMYLSPPTLSPGPNPSPLTSSTPMFFGIPPSFKVILLSLGSLPLDFLLLPFWKIHPRDSPSLSWPCKALRSCPFLIYCTFPQMSNWSLFPSHSLYYSIFCSFSISYLISYSFLLLYLLFSPSLLCTLSLILLFLLKWTLALQILCLPNPTSSAPGVDLLKTATQTQPLEGPIWDWSFLPTFPPLQQLLLALTPNPMGHADAEPQSK